VLEPEAVEESVGVGGPDEVPLVAGSEPGVVEPLEVEVESALGGDGDDPDPVADASPGAGARDEVPPVDWSMLGAPEAEPERDDDVAEGADEASGGGGATEDPEVIMVDPSEGGGTEDPEDIMLGG